MHHANHVAVKIGLVFLGSALLAQQPMPASAAPARRLRVGRQAAAADESWRQLVWYNSYSPSNFGGAEAFCASKGRRLATYDEYCAKGSVVGDVIAYAANPTLCLSYSPISLRGGHIHLRTCNGDGDASQQWRHSDDAGHYSQMYDFRDDGTIRFKANPTLCVSLHGGLASDGATVNLQTCDGRASQQWLVGAGKIVGDQWAPYSGDGDNQWVQVGTAHTECMKHSTHYGKPAWGMSTDKHSFENYVLCALRTPPLSYQGCYNTGGGINLGGFSANTLFETCADKASTGSKPFFGMEYPHGSATPGAASCHYAMNKLPSARVADSECGAPYNGRRLGGAWRVAVYAFTAPSDAFKVIFVSDLERNYRGHTNQDIEDVMDEIIAQNPALVIHGGDNYDAEHSGDKDKKYYRKLLDSGIPFITTNGNHDGQNSAAETFVRESYTETAKLAVSPLTLAARKFTFSWEPAGAHGYKAEFNGLQIASFLWKGKPGDPKKYDPLTDDEADAMKLKLDTSKPTLVVNHHPNVAAVNTLVQAFPARSAVFSGHTHESKTQEIAPGYLEHTAPYPHQWESMINGKADHKRGRAMLSVLVSPTKGVFSVTEIDTVLRSRTWPDGTRCSSTLDNPPWDTCHKCKNGWAWWNSRLGEHCGPAREYGRELGVPMIDKGCPPHYVDFGLVCKRCTWSSWTPWSPFPTCDVFGSLGCRAGLEQVGLLCYKPCRAGYHGSGLYCVQR